MLTTPESSSQGQSCSVSTIGASRQYPKESPSSSPSQVLLMQDHEGLKSPRYTPIAGMSVLPQQGRVRLGEELQVSDIGRASLPCELYWLKWLFLKRSLLETTSRQ